MEKEYIIENVSLENVEKNKEVETKGRNHKKIYIDVERKRFYKIERYPNSILPHYIYNLRKKQLEVNQTQFPLGCIYDKTHHCIGTNQVYFDQYETFVTLYQQDLQYKLNIFEVLLHKLEELHYAGIYHLDLQSENILYQKNQVQIVDWNDFYTSIYPEPNRKMEKRILVEIETILLQILLGTMSEKENLRKIFLIRHPYMIVPYEKWITSQQSFYGYYQMLEELHKKDIIKELILK